MKKITEHEIIVHGVEHEQYFQGCGVSCTLWTDVGTGIGDTAREALDDALESLAEADWNVEPRESEILADLLDQKIIGITVLPKDAHDEMHVYVSVRVR